MVTLQNYANKDTQPVVSVVMTTIWTTVHAQITQDCPTNAAIAMVHIKQMTKLVRNTGRLYQS